MTLPERAHPAAGAEYLDALRYYEAIRSQLADEFEASIDRAIRDIQWNPEAWARYPGWNRLPVVRTHVVTVFPYSVVYFVHDGELVIVAFAHERRRPGYWRTRLHDLL